MSESGRRPTHEEVVLHAQGRAAAVALWPEWKRRDLRFFDGGAAPVAAEPSASTGAVVGDDAGSGQVER